ncbi:MAG: hypothetical protein HY943_18115 [Gammaproteobacteria bacterium]|nr:hypothetical protein [Gammaproteobacteria bacterium]
MNPRAIFSAALFSGSIAGLASTLVLMARGRRETGEAATTLNGPAQWVYGKHVPYQDGFRLPYTPVGFAIHHACSIFWALAFELVTRRLRRDTTLPAALGTAAGAWIVDYHVTPQRFRPGFEHRLSRASLLGVYGAFALGLAAAHRVRTLRRERPAP